MRRKLLGFILVALIIGIVGTYAYWSLTRGPIPIRFGYSLWAEDAPIFVAAEKGFFKEMNLNVSLTIFASGIPMMEAVSANKLDGGFAPIVQVLQGFDGGIDVRFVCGGSLFDKDHDANAIVVAFNSSINSIEDLRGKIVCVGSYSAQPMAPMQLALNRNGLTMDDVKFYVIQSSPTRLQALLSGTVDAAFLGEPYLTPALNAGQVRIIYRPLTEIFSDHKFQLSTSFFAKAFIDKNKDAVNAFIKAYEKAVDWINDHQTETRSIVANWTGMDLELTKKIIMPLFLKDVDQTGLHNIIDMLLEYGYIEKDIAVNDILYQD